MLGRSTVEEIDLETFEEVRQSAWNGGLIAPDESAAESESGVVNFESKCG